MLFETLDIPDVIKITPRSFKDDRGTFMETFKSSAFNEAIGRDVKFVQDNQSLCIKTKTVRGLHFQAPPFAQGKLIRCINGAIVDVAVDVRLSSPSYGKWASAKLTAENNCQLWVPEGFLHGFSTLMPHTIIQYKCTNYYSPEHEGNIAWNDKELNIDWGIDPKEVTLSDRDSVAPCFESFKSPFGRLKSPLV